MSDRSPQEIRDKLLEFFPARANEGRVTRLAKILGMGRNTLTYIGRHTQSATVQRMRILLEACELLEAEGLSRDQIRCYFDDPTSSLARAVLIDPSLAHSLG